MANKFLDENGLLYFWQKITTKFATKDEIANAGSGDMLKSVYDTDNNGKVDDADKLGGQLPSFYATAEEVSKKANDADLKTVAKTGSYKDLIDKPDNFAPASHTHQQSEVVGLEDAIGAMAEIAQGKCKSYTFDTVEELDTWLANEENTADLNTGDVFLIRAVDVPDYWWDGETSTKRVLETTKVDLTSITNAEIDAILAT